MVVVLWLVGSSGVIELRVVVVGVVVVLVRGARVVGLLRACTLSV